MPYIEMQDLSKDNDNDSGIEKRTYKKFPFFIGKEIKINISLENFCKNDEVKIKLEALKIKLESLKLKPLKFEPLKISFDFKAVLTSSNYKTQSEDNRSKSIGRFWKDTELSLVNLCCETIAKKLLDDPIYFGNRNNTLPEELNNIIDQKLDAVNDCIRNEKFYSFSSKLNYRC